MKKKLIYSFLIVYSLLAISCSPEFTDSEQNDGKPYYKFTDGDKTKILNAFTINQLFTYKNQNNEQLIFKVIRINIGKSKLFTGNNGGMGGISYGNRPFIFSYDEQEILFSYVDGYYEWSTIKVNIFKYPIDIQQQFQTNSAVASGLRGYFKFPFWNGYRGLETYNNEINIDFSLPTITMISNGKTYSKVLVFESNKTIILAPNSQLPALPKNVHKIYYDQNFGVIGFDDLNGKMWRIQ